MDDFSYDPQSGVLATVTETLPGQAPEIHTIDHDVAGNLTDDDLSTYDYNPSGTLAWQGLDAALPLVGFEYDSGGRRVATLADPGGANEERREHCLLPDGRPWFVEESSGARTWQIYLGSQLVATVNDEGGGSPRARFIIGNHLGYPEMVFDDMENPLWVYPLWASDHLPFGETIFESGSAFDPLLRYPGQWAVPEGEGLGLTELFYNGYRWYRPDWGRYSQSDPIGLLGGRNNLYSYAAANPIRYVDTLGLSPNEPPYRDPFSPLGLCKSFKDRPTTGCKCNTDLIRERLKGAAALKDGYCGAARAGAEDPSQIRNPFPKTHDKTLSPFARGVQIGGIYPIAWYADQGDGCLNSCICAHEEQHERDWEDPKFIRIFSGTDEKQKRQFLNETECASYNASVGCLSNYLR